MKHTISLLVENKPGVLSRVASLFSGRGFNIESLSVAETIDPKVSRMTILTTGDDQILEQITKQLNKLINVIKVIDFKSNEYVGRELALIKVRATSANRSEIIEIVDIFRANIVDVAADSMTIEITGDEDKIESLLNLIRSFGIREIARTGRIAMVRGGKGSLTGEEKTSKVKSTK